MTRSSEQQERFIQTLMAENAALRARIARLEAALRDIEMETRPGGQWTLAKVNEAARAALTPAPAPLMAFTPRTLIDVVSDIEDLKGIHLDMTHEQLDSLYDRQFERLAALTPAPAPGDGHER